MDTTEELNGTYFYNGLYHLSAGELFFFIFLEEASTQLGVNDIATLALIILGQPHLDTRNKPAGATQGTSFLSEYLRTWLKIKVRRWPTLTNESIKHLRFSYVNNLGAFVGRWIPILGIVYLLSDVTVIAWKATNKYNTIAKGGDKLWN
ncbi:MAG: STM2901 family protein [Mixta sp.]